MFCRNCGAALEGQPRFCGVCGSPTAANASAFANLGSKARNERHAGRRIRIGIFLILAIIVFFYWIDSPSDQHKDTELQKPTESEPVDLKYAVGQQFTVGYWSYRCDGAHWQRTVGSQYLNQTADAEFYVIELTATNNDRTASVLPPLKLVDEQNREHDQSSAEIYLDNSFGSLKTLNPGVTSHGLVVFDVPPGTYKLKVSGGFESDRYALVDLEKRSDSLSSSQQNQSEKSAASNLPPAQSPSSPVPPEPPPSQDILPTNGSEVSDTPVLDRYAIALRAEATGRGYSPIGKAWLVPADEQGGQLLIQPAQCSEIASDHCQKLFIAFNSKFLGTDTFSPSWSVHNVAREGVGKFSAVYEDYSDPTKTRPPLKIVYTWDGKKITASGTPPTHPAEKQR